MRRAYRIPKKIKDPETGKMIPKRNSKGQIEYLPNWYIKFLKADGTLTTLTYRGRSKSEAQEWANELQTQQNRIARGAIPLPDEYNRQFNLPYTEVVEKFIRRGKSEGGRRNHPWSDKVAASHIHHLKWWQRELNLQTLGDLQNCLADVEDALLDLLDVGSEPEKYRSQGKSPKPASPKTRNDYLNSLFAFCTYAKERKYLREHPLLGVTWLPHSPAKENRRRNWTNEELTTLLDNTPSYRMIVYETAAHTGFRRKELSSLTLEHLDTERNILRLEKQDDKARLDREQPIPSALASKLLEYGKSGEAARLYQQFPLKTGTKVKVPDKPLLYVPTHISRQLDDDLERLDIPKHTEDGKLVFHCFRVAYINMLFEMGAEVKEVQDLARHSDIRITQMYARPNKDAKRTTVEALYQHTWGQRKV